MKEEWKDINGYEGNYQISNFGNVFNKNWNRPVKQYINKGNGYFEVHLFKKCKRTHFTIHRLVAMHFIEKEDGKNIVNHISSDKHNNVYTNLEWVTKSENGIHAGKAGLISVCLRKKVDQFTLNGILIKTYTSMAEASRSLNLQVSNISACCRGKMMYTGGFIWKFSKE